jgi:hypothetical protein
MQRMTSKRTVKISIGIILLLLIFTVLGFLFWPKPSAKVVIPASISRQYNFQLLVPNNTTPAQVSEVSKTLKYDKQNKVLSFVTVVNNKHVTISEQAYPEVLVYDKLINGFNVYSTLDLKAGKVYLGHPGNPPGSGQAAVTRTDNLLIFGKPDQNLTDDQWRTIFDNLAPVK